MNKLQHLVSNRLSRKAILLLSILVIIPIFPSVFAQPETEVEVERKQIELPSKSNELTTDSLHTSQQLTEQNLNKFEFVIGKNQTFAGAIDSINSNNAATIISKIYQAKNSDYFVNINIGDKLIFWVDEDNNIHHIDLEKTKTLTYHLHITAEQNLNIYASKKPIEVKIKMVSGTINDSFYLAGEKAGLSAKTIMNLADIFAWEVDFARQLRSGDQFKVIYEQKYLDGDYLGDGQILAAELSLSNKPYKAFQLRDADGKHLGYYNDEGKNLRKAFLRNPINYTRISSHFQRKRHHPIKKELRDHKGVDYAAPTGTPIYAAGNGVVSYKNWRGGYGRMIIVKHAGKYETVYAHMSRYGKFNVGQTVKQGDVIGYVGMSGMATGPHLHYEFRINGVHYDPLRVKFPDAAPVQKAYKNQFMQYANLMDSQLSRIDPEITQLAMSFE